MEKKTLLAIAMLVVLAAAAYGVLRAPEKGQRIGPPPRPVAEIKAADIAAVEINNLERKEEIVLERRDSGWMITKPTEWKADQSATKQLVEGVEKMSFADLVTEQADKHEEMGVSDKNATKVVLKDKGGKVLADLYVGKSLGGFTMLRVEGQNNVWQASGIYPYLFNRDGRAWRDHVVFEFPWGDVDKLAIESTGQKLVVEKVPAPAPAPAGPDAGAPPAAPENKWKIVESVGDAPKTLENLDLTLVTTAAQALGALRANDFADGKKPEEVGLDKPNLKVTATVKSTDYTIEFGNMVSDDLYARRSDSPVIYTFKRFGIDRINHPPIDYRDKTLAKAAESDIASIDISYGADTYSLYSQSDSWLSKKGPVDQTKVKQVVTAFENLQAGSFTVEKDASKLGFAKPTGSLTLRKKDKASVSLKIGGTSKDGSEYYVQKQGTPHVYVVKKYAVDRFLRHWKDLEPTRVPPGSH